VNLDKLDIKEIGNYFVLNQINPERKSKSYKVKHKFTEELRVLKVVVAEVEADLKKIEQTFKRLSQGISKLHNPNMIKFKEFFISELGGQKCFVLVSEYFSGQELDGFLQNQGNSSSYEELKSIFLNVCSAVDAAHHTVFQDEHGVQIEGFPHGDITAKNILINNQYQLKLLDFKLSNRFTVSEEKSAYEKLSVIVPEQKNSKLISKRSDIFQLGYLLKYLFCTDRNYRTWKLEEKSESEILSQLDKSKTQGKEKRIARVIFDCTREKPSDRLGSVKDIVDRLKGESKRSPKVGPANYSKSLLAIAGSVMLLVLGWFAINFFQASDTSELISDNSRGVKPKVENPASSEVVIGDYYALMIANESYSHLKKLNRPIQDLNTFKKILTSNFGFKEDHIVQMTNATRDDIYDGFEKIERKLKAQDNLLIFYAGHGQIHEATGYWIPVEGDERSRRNWISNSEIKKFLNSIVARNVLVVSDACFGGSILRDINTYDPSKANISNKKSRIALTSGSLESVPDHSIFIDQLFWYMENTSDSLVYASNIFSEIREGILSNTTNDPGYGPIRDSGHQGGDFFFIKK